MDLVLKEKKCIYMIMAQKADHYLTEVINAGQRVKFIKVKGHAGNTFNELVDKLAKEESNKAQMLLGK